MEIGRRRRRERGWEKKGVYVREEEGGEERDREREREREGGSKGEGEGKTERDKQRERVGGRKKVAGGGLLV